MQLAAGGGELGIGGAQMRSGFWVIAIFGAAWASAGLLMSGHPLASVLAPIAISFSLLGLAYRTPGTAVVRSAQARRQVSLWSLIEGVAIVVAINLLNHFHRSDALFPAIAIIVGLHFFPLAKGMAIRPYYVTGAALMGIGLVGLLIPPEHRAMFVGLCAAVALWGTGVYRLWDVRLAAAV